MKLIKNTRNLFLSFIKESTSDNLNNLHIFIKKLKPKNKETEDFINEFLNTDITISIKNKCAKAVRYIDMGVFQIIDDSPKIKKQKPEIKGDLDLFEKFNLPFSVLKGCGEKTEKKLNEAGYFNISDLLSILPSKYMDLRKISTIDQLVEDNYFLLKVKIKSVARVRGNIFATASDDTGSIKLSWFHIYPYLFQFLQKENEVFLIGTPTKRGSIFNFSHPLISFQTPEPFLISYPKIEGIGEKKIRDLIIKGIDLFKNDNFDPLPENILEKYNFPSWFDCLKKLHNPSIDLSTEEFHNLSTGDHETRVRMAYEELFYLQVALGLKRSLFHTEKSFKLKSGGFSKILKVFNFEFTNAQTRVVKEILSDMKTGFPMNRLLQGDVGSGKTAVAFTIAGKTILENRQVALMAPTTLLAQQHYENLKVWGDKLNFNIVLLTADTPKGARESVLVLLEAGKIDLIIGTHSLIQKSVIFYDLGLVIIDEQHRFGVFQRALLRNKGKDIEPHLLVMTATPIPRSLALTVYGDLDCAIIDEMPPHRLPVITKICSQKREKLSVIKKFGKILKKDEKIFVVVGLIDKGEKSHRIDINQAAEYLKINVENAIIGIIHGRLKNDEKNKLINDFRNGKINILVATTVIEVGMDIPDAKYMLILEADHFGLSQLHQLRGRIGRSPHSQAFCYLFTSKKQTKDGKQRLKLIEKINSGFTLSEEDLKMRGPGEIIGTRQAGALSLRYSSLVNNGDLLIKARTDAIDFLKEDPLLTKEKNQYISILARRNINRFLIGSESG
jgi:ATP-dependent DNA helicase RecG